MPTAKYSNYLEINPSFESVVDIDADTRNTNLWREYIVGDDMESLVEQMCQSIGNEAPDLRAPSGFTALTELARAMPPSSSST